MDEELISLEDELNMILGTLKEDELNEKDLCNISARLEVISEIIRGKNRERQMLGM